MALVFTLMTACHTKYSVVNCEALEAFHTWVEYEADGFSTLGQS